MKKGTCIHTHSRVFPRPFRHGRQVQGDKALMEGGTHERGIDLMGGGPACNFDRLYHKLKVLLHCS